MAEAVAAAAVDATRGPAGCGGPVSNPNPRHVDLPPRDFLLLKPGGRLVLHVGAHALCGVALRPPALADADPVARLTQWGSEGAGASILHIDDHACQSRRPLCVAVLCIGECCLCSCVPPP